jgi:hypothetical protein
LLFLLLLTNFTSHFNPSRCDAILLPGPLLA